jgi:TonB family protein
MRHVCFVLLVSAIVLFAQNGEEPTDVSGWLNRGVQAFKAAKYDDAIQAFQRAVELDPTNVNAHLYLGTSFFVQYIPGAQAPDTIAFADKARGEFEDVLRMEPDNKTAIQYLASIAYQSAAGTSDLEEKYRRLDVARSWYEKLASLDPQNKEAWYSLGVIDWMRWYPKFMEALKQAGMKPDDPRPISNTAIRLELKDSEPLVMNGLSKLQRALDIDPQYDEAMAYMNLLVRERASLDDTVEQYQADIDIANNWVQKSLDAKKAQAVGPATPSRIRVGGNVQRCNLLMKVDPVYPALAQQARIQGTVRFQVIISADGHVHNTQLVSGHPLLVQAATEAVQQWVYRPTILNGKAVEVVTTVDVPFVLDAAEVGDNPCHM